MIRKDLVEAGELSKAFVMLFTNYSNSNLRVHFLTSSKLKQENMNVILVKIREI